MKLVSLALAVMAWHPPAVTAADAGAGTPVVTEARGFTLQVAAFESRAQAERLAAGLEGSWIQEASSDGRIVFRVNYRRFDDRGEAVRAQWELEDLGYKGFIRPLFA